VADGQAALDRLSAERFDLLLLDLLMPVLNGFQVLERLRHEPDLGAMPVLVLTQYMLNDLERQILKQHRATILLKSASFDQILFAVGSALHPEGANLRRHHRLPVFVPLTVRAGATVYQTQCFNLSEEGMFVILPGTEGPPEGADVTLKFWVPEAAEILEVKARVAWVNRPGALRRNHPPGFGVELRDTDLVVRDALKRFLESQG